MYCSCSLHHLIRRSTQSAAVLFIQFAVFPSFFFYLDCVYQSYWRNPGFCVYQSYWRRCGFRLNGGGMVSVYESYWRRCGFRVNGGGMASVSISPVCVCQSYWRRCGTCVSQFDWRSQSFYVYQSLLEQAWLLCLSVLLEVPWFMGLSVLFVEVCLQCLLVSISSLGGGMSSVFQSYSNLP